MAEAIAIPRLGWSMEEGTFREWLKTSGQTVAPGEVLYVLEGEKASQEIESIDGGILWIPPDAPRPDDIVKVGQVIGYLLAVGETPPTEPVPTRPSASPQRPQGIEPPPAAPVVQKGRRLVATPRARHRARQLSVDWTGIAGTGRDGRIRERDVIAFASTTSSPHASKIRQAIAQRMLAGVKQTAPVTLTTKADATELVRWRNLAKENSRDGLTPSFTEIIVKLVAAVLPECPSLNASWQDDQVRVYDEIHVAVAVDTDQGLLAPVIANADRLSLRELTNQFRDLIERARTGTLSQNQLRGGTFTVTNLGAFGIDYFTPIINVPQAAILGIGRIAREPVVRGESIVIGETVGLSLTFDHRVIDGAPAARWLQRLCQAIKTPGETLDRMQ